MAQDWKTIPDSKEKYQLYLCSREWGVLKEAVHGFSIAVFAPENRLHLVAPKPAKKEGE